MGDGESLEDMLRANGIDPDAFATVLQLLEGRVAEVVQTEVSDRLALAESKILKLLEANAVLTREVERIGRVLKSNGLG